MSDTPFVAEINLLPYNFCPRGWAWCDGQLLPISQNTALFSLLGTTYGGDGKSTFALHSARQLASAYPDGQLYLDLAGTADVPRDPAALLAELLGSLGVSGRAIPDEPAARSALLRSVLADRRVLLFLDDACSAEQVRPLLPPHGGSAVVVTSRRLLTGLAGARHVQLDPLDPASAYDLLARIVGSDRVATEFEVAQDITRACGYLPLSIRIAGGKLLGRPGVDPRRAPLTPRRREPPSRGAAPR